MKKLLLLPVFAFLFAACSADTEDVVFEHSAERAINLGTSKAPTLACFSSLGAHVEIDLSNGFGNGLINFVSEPPAGVTGAYKVLVYVEELSDCEDLTSGNGKIKTFTSGLYYSNISANPPVVAGIDPSETFGCYRWKMVFNSYTRNGDVLCSAATQWHDAPLF